MLLKFNKWIYGEDVKKLAEYHVLNRPLRNFRYGLIQFLWQPNFPMNKMLLFDT